MLQALYPADARPDGGEPRAVWFQPGAESEEIRAYVAKRNLHDKVVLGGPCILVLGDRLLADTQRQAPKL